MPYSAPAAEKLESQTEAAAAKYDNVAEAALKGDANCVTALVQKRGHDPNEKDKDGTRPPAYCAAWKNHVGCLRALKGLGADMSAPRSSDGETPVAVAARFGHLDAARFLHSDCGCDMSTPSNDGRTPLWDAAFYGHLKMVKLLHAECGCDPTTPDKRGRSPLQIAEQRGHTDVAAYLRSVSASEAGGGGGQQRQEQQRRSQRRSAAGRWRRTEEAQVSVEGVLRLSVPYSASEFSCCLSSRVT